MSEVETIAATLETRFLPCALVFWRPWRARGDCKLCRAGVDEELPRHLVDRQGCWWICLCAISLQSLDALLLPSLWHDYDNNAGWLKAASQAMETMIFGAGAYDNCIADL